MKSIGNARAGKSLREYAQETGARLAAGTRKDRGREGIIQILDRRVLRGYRVPL